MVFDPDRKYSEIYGVIPGASGARYKQDDTYYDRFGNAVGEAEVKVIPKAKQPSKPAGAPPPPKGGGDTQNVRFLKEKLATAKDKLAKENTAKNKIEVAKLTKELAEEPK